MRVRILLLAAMLVAGAVFGFADADGHGRSIADVEQQIRQTLGVGENDRIDPDAVPETLMVELGDAVMAERIGNETQHEWMDEMMGGDGELMGNPDVYRRGYPGQTPKEILDRRYASGEITRQAYLQMLEDIQ